jgi:hypothetical protein
MENRDRKYDPDIYSMRGIYTMQDLDFNLSQFGFFLTNDNIMITFHLKNCVDTLGRKLMAGDVLELPHLKDEYALGDSMVALKRFYVITDVSRAATGFSQTWYPHLLRAKCEPLVDSQEFKQILDADAGDGENSLRDIISMYKQNLAVNDQILAQAEADAPLSGYDTSQFWIVPQNPDQTIDLEDTSMTDRDASEDDHTVDASSVFAVPDKNVYVSYLKDDGRPPNGAPYTFGLDFPTAPTKGSYHLRTDYMPNRLFRYDGLRWVFVEKNVRTTLTELPTDGSAIPNSQSRQTLVSGFINNSNTATIAGKVVEERQSLSKALKSNKPKADF